MPAKIPWEIIGPVAAGVIVILVVVFGFMLKWQKQSKEKIPQNPPSNLNTISKKTICFQHESRISSNETAVKMIGDSLKEANEKNREDHGKIFDKMDDMREKIITEIHKQ